MEAGIEVRSNSDHLFDLLELFIEGEEFVTTLLDEGDQGTVLVVEELVFGSVVLTKLFEFDDTVFVLLGLDFEGLDTGVEGVDIEVGAYPNEDKEEDNKEDDLLDDLMHGVLL